MMIRILEMLACSALFTWGGYNWHNARRYLMPILLAISAYQIVYTWWVLTMLFACGAFSLGYGIKSPLRHIFGDGWGRGVWGLIAALALSVGLLSTGHLAWQWFLVYLALNFTLENVFKNFNQILGDMLIGAGFASILFIIY